jgi:hypothetical protein
MPMTEEDWASVANTAKLVIELVESNLQSYQKQVYELREVIKKLGMELCVDTKESIWSIFYQKLPVNIRKELDLEQPPPTTTTVQTKYGPKQFTTMKLRDSKNLRSIFVSTLEQFGDDPDLFQEFASKNKVTITEMVGYTIASRLRFILEGNGHLGAIKHHSINKDT